LLSNFLALAVTFRTYPQAGIFILIPLVQYFNIYYFFYGEQ